MNNRFLAWAIGQPWMIRQATMESALKVLTARNKGERATPAKIAGVVSSRDERREPVIADRVSVMFDDDDDVILSGPTSPPPPRGMSRDPKADKGYFMAGKVAVVPVDGIICKYASQINGMSQPQGCTPTDLADAVLGAWANPACECTVLDIDSPGGTVAGGEDVVEAIQLARSINPTTKEIKPVIAYAHDNCCSGAMLLASQCDEVYCSANAIVGSIGVYQAFYDESDALAKDGVQVRVVASGPYKGAGAPGAPISQEHLDKFQQEVNDLAKWLTTRVADGRGMSFEDCQKLATGEVWIGQDAVDRGLADGVMGFGELIAQLNSI